MNKVSPIDDTHLFYIYTSYVKKGTVTYPYRDICYKHFAIEVEVTQIYLVKKSLYRRNEFNTGRHNIFQCYFFSFLFYYFHFAGRQNLLKVLMLTDKKLLKDV